MKFVTQWDGKRVWIYTAQDHTQGKYVRRVCTLGQDEYTTGTYVRVTGGAAPVRYSLLARPLEDGTDMVTQDDATADDLAAARAFVNALHSEDEM